VNFLELPLKSRKAAFAKMDAADKAKKGANLKPRKPAAKKTAAKKAASPSRAQIDKLIADSNRSVDAARRLTSDIDRRRSAKKTPPRKATPRKGKPAAPSRSDLISQMKDLGTRIDAESGPTDGLSLEEKKAKTKRMQGLIKESQRLRRLARAVK